MTFLLIPLDEAIVFPGVTATLPIDTADEDRVFLLPRQDGEFGRIGVVAEVVERAQLPNGGWAATVVGLHRGLAGAAQSTEGVKIRDDVDSGAQKQQREYFLRKQMESIRKELGEDEADLIGEYEKKIADAEMPEAVAEQAEKELRRLERQGEQSPESSMIRSYLD